MQKSTFEIAVYELVRAFVFHNSILLQNDEVSKVASLAVVTWQKREPVSPKTQHEFLYSTDPRAGEYRDAVLVNCMGQMRDYPKASVVPLYMDRFFMPAYERICAGGVPHTEDKRADVAWQLGAILRAIHPFFQGNLILSWVIENQLCLLFGLSPIIGLRPKAEFDAFRHNVFFPVVEKSVY